MESPTKEIEEFESNSLKYLQPEQIEKIWLRLRGLCCCQKQDLESFAQFYLPCSVDPVQQTVFYSDLPYSALGLNTVSVYRFTYESAFQSPGIVNNC
ncbi:hypothetical protein WISP_57885 [Willisornis vidua]|uniref:Uncharacterized protein n=1 Tax=Willisornis vidua TaxID=1566151 RepID=A0ABQ9DCT7_9PASS|nr:hypothetical protein WISP_57885 [Willisornis vidua]